MTGLCSTSAETGIQSRASEVLNRRRPLTLPMIRALSIEWNLPADVLVREYDLANATSHREKVTADARK